MRLRSACSLAFVATLACRSQESATIAAQKSGSTPLNVGASASVAAPSSVTPTRFGQTIAPGETLALATVLAKPDAFENRAVTVEAKVRRNCTRRGCWMELAEQLNPNLPGCRVTFKDYGFFVPLDSAGSTARVQGTVQILSVPASEVQHLESEGAKFAAKQPDGTAREVRMVATGVELWREPG